MPRRFLLPWSIAATMLLSVACAEDWPQWRGPNRNGIVRDTGLVNAWQESAELRVVWRREVGKGHSAVSIAAGSAYTLGWDGKEDTVFCFDATTGEPKWRMSYACEGILQWSGPRSTPTIADGAVFTLGQWGQLRAWNARDGKLLWRRDLDRRCNPDVDYGFTWSPALVGGRLILATGGSGLAFDPQTGKPAWGDEGRAGATFSATTYLHDGKPAVIVAPINAERTAFDLVGVDAASGKELWRYGPWKESWGAAGVDPVVADGKIFLTSAQEYRRAARFTIDGATLREDWSTERFAGYTGGCVLLDGRLYGVDARGILKCLDWETGKDLWARRGFDERGTLISVDGALLIQTGASGELVLVAADPAGYRELRRMKVFVGEGATYTPPSIAAGRVYCRSYAGEIVCLAP